MDEELGRLERVVRKSEISVSGTELQNGVSVFQANFQDVLFLSEQVINFRSILWMEGEVGVHLILRIGHRDRHPISFNFLYSLMLEFEIPF
jgi:hypothetical protein